MRFVRAVVGGWVGLGWDICATAKMVVVVVVLVVVVLMVVVVLDGL